MVLSKHAERREMAAAGANPGMGATTGMGPGTGMTGGMHHATGPTDAGLGAGTMTGTHHAAAGTGGGLTGHSNNPMTGNGMTGTNNAGAAGMGTAAPGAMNNSNPQGRSSGTMKNVEGKLEKTLGNITCNPTLKMKGVQKEQEAAAIRMQNTHLTEAERLEQVAGAHRERAVVGGAHPEQRHVGGVRPSGMNETGPGQQMVNQPGTGGIGGNPVLPGGGASHGGAAY